MWKPKRLIAIVLVVIVLIVIAAAVAVRMLLGGDTIKAAIEAQATSALGRPVAIRSAVPRLFPRVSLDMTDVVIGASREVTIDRVQLSTGFRGLIQRRVQDAEITVERSQIDVRWALALLAALAEPPNTEAPVATSPYALTIDSITTISLREVTLVAGSHSLRVEMDSWMSGPDRFTIRRLRGRSDQSSLTAAGEMTSIAKRTGSFKIDAQSLDLDGLLAFLAAATPAGARQIAPGAERAPATDAVPFKIDIDVHARRARALGVALTNLSTICRLIGERVSLENLQVELFDGRYTGGAAFIGAREPRYEWRGQFDNLDVPQVVAFAGAPGSITGRLGGSLALTAAGADPQQAIGRARGSARVAVTDGRVPGLEIVRSVILAFGKPTGDRPEGSGEAFSRLAATLAVNGPSLSTSDLTFASRDFDMNGEGRLSLASQAVDFHADVILSRELSAQAGRDLYRLARDGERIVLPARITGTASSPTVFIDVQSALQRALRNKMEDEVKGLFDRFRKRVIK
jgi:uncharacterized protein involved in outer membrane biogenesis